MKRFVFRNTGMVFAEAVIGLLWLFLLVFNVLKKAIEPMLPAGAPQALAGEGVRRSTLARGILWLARGCGNYALVPHLEIGADAIAHYQAGTFARWMIAKVITDYELFTWLAPACERYFRGAANAAPLWIDVQRALGYMILFQGRREEGMAQLTKAESLRDDLARCAGMEPDAKVFLPPDTPRIMGGIGHIDAYVKYRILSNDPRPYFLLARPGEIVNRAFLDYWRDYVTIITNAAEVRELSVAECVYGVGWLGAMPQGNGIGHVHGVIAGLQRQWSAERRPPLLRLRPDHAERLAAQKKKWGMTSDDWFICLHIRSSGFHRQKQGGAEDFRSAPVENYYPLIRSIVAAGGWVVRMGDASMPALDPKEYGDSGLVIDYAHSTGKTAEMDVALGASCRLFVGQSSGLHTIPHAFGRPCCLVNIPFNTGFPWHVEDLFIPKLYFSRPKNRVLTLEEIFSSTVIEADNQFLLAVHEIVLLPNSADDIVETVAEALQPDSYSVEREEVARSVVGEYERLNARYATKSSGRLGRYFAMKHAQQLRPANAMAPA